MAEFEYPQEGTGSNYDSSNDPITPEDEHESAQEKLESIGFIFESEGDLRRERDEDDPFKVDDEGVETGERVTMLEHPSFGRVAIIGGVVYQPLGLTLSEAFEL